MVLARAVAVALALTAGATPALAAAAAGRPPNVIFVMADNMGHADIGPYGQKAIATPHLDRMAREGMLFTAAYVGGSLCSPSRSVLMTGQHLGHTRVRGNASTVAGTPDHNGVRRVPLARDDVTAAKVLQGAGYATGMTGKWGLGEPGSTGEPNLHGFDEWLGLLNNNRAHTHYPDHLWRNREKIPLPGNQHGRREQYSHGLFTDFALDFIRRHRTRPFFLYVPYTLPHPEHAVPSLGRYADRPWTPEEKAYAAKIDLIDRDMGRIFALLAELGLDESTAVFFCSDNGGSREFDGRFDSNGALRGQYGDLYEGGLRTPMLVRWPGRIPAGARSDLIWMFADVLPTLAEIAGLRPPSVVDGVSVLPTLLGRQQTLDRMLYWEQQHSPRGFEQAVRWGRWKGIRRARSAATFELFDLARDRAEKKMSPPSATTWLTRSSRSWKKPTCRRPSGPSACRLRWPPRPRAQKSDTAPSSRALPGSRDRPLV